ncbi:TadE-like protein [Microterricola gilva]|uniref:TadE-like protein n=1 Tax=Microterricola gilva TaxID=393267 RepID=A0A4Q8APZ2_9MICO|nr:TadE/TadG family type IV pilus assembly protein [Microterricola gilva]RZU66668.1 TadE-like protein [Microterricola gilva]
MKRLRIRRDERGAAAIEFALILPILLVLVLGIVEFGRAYNVQISLSNAAREGARSMAIHNSVTDARAAAIGAAPSIQPAIAASQITISPSSCASGGTVNVTIRYPLELLTGFFEDTFELTSVGVMRCGG